MTTNNVNITASPFVFPDKKVGLWIARINSKHNLSIYYLDDEMNLMAEDDDVPVASGKKINDVEFVKHIGNITFKEFLKNQNVK